MEECSQMMKRRTKEMKRRMRREMKRRMKREQCSQMMNLPRELLIEILLRLPVKCLARVKCVSKLWLSLISNPNFTRSHYDLALAPTHTLLLSSYGCRKIASIDFNASSLHDYTTKILEPPIPRLRHPKFLGSCRGFILIDFFDDLYVWNPCTDLHRRIPSPPISDRTFLHGFGYDSSTDDYLVTLGCYEGHGCDEIRVVIFSVRANTWKQFDGIIPETLKYYRVGSYLGGLFFNGALHWMSNDRGWGGSVVGGVIVAFDLTERVFFEIETPDCSQYGELHVVIGGFLSVCPYSWGASNDKLLVMEEYNRVQSSWKCLRFSNHLHQFEPSWHPLFVTMGGDIVAIDTDFRELGKLNCKGQVLERRDYHDYPDRHYPDRDLGRPVVSMHTHTLFSLPCLR